jgi:hypothetical protein
LGYLLVEVAGQLGVSTSSISKTLLSLLPSAKAPTFTDPRATGSLTGFVVEDKAKVVNRVTVIDREVTKVVNVTYRSFTMR